MTHVPRLIFSSRSDPLGDSLLLVLLEGSVTAELRPDADEAEGAAPEPATAGAHAPPLEAARFEPGAAFGNVDGRSAMVSPWQRYRRVVKAVAREPVRLLAVPSAAHRSAVTHALKPLVDLVLRAPAFSVWSRDRATRLCASARERSYGPGAAVAVQHEPQRSVLVVLRGELSAAVTDPLQRSSAARLPLRVPPRAVGCDVETLSCADCREGRLRPGESHLFKVRWERQDVELCVWASELKPVSAPEDEPVASLSLFASAVHGRPCAEAHQWAGTMTGARALARTVRSVHPPPPLAWRLQVGWRVG